jgi:hypothetical protein
MKDAKLELEQKKKDKPCYSIGINNQFLKLVYIPIFLVSIYWL